MKKFSYLIILLFFISCADLNVDIESELTSDNFPITKEQFVSASASIYSQFASEYGENYWKQSILSSDAALLTANGGNWYDGGKYKRLHLHTWNKNSDIIETTWDWLFTTINICNSVYDLFRKADDSDFKNTSISELRVMRALCYYLLVDNFGDVPLITEFGQDVPARSTRKDVFNYIETEVLESVDHLETGNDEDTYGRPNQMTAYALLAKLYLNAKIFTGEGRYNDVVEMCDLIIANEASGLVGLYDDYVKMFDNDNGSAINEFIFAIPYDENNIDGFRPSRYWLSVVHPYYWNLNFSTSSCFRGVPEFYDLFPEDPNDKRADTWLTEEQYARDGVTPMIYPTTNIGLDSRYAGDDPEGVVYYHVRFTKEIEFRDEENFDTGDDIVGRLVGYRSNKFNPSSSQLTRYQSNDFPVFRYADILLMKAEAILRGAAETNGETALSLVNRVRERAGAAGFETIDLNTLLDERGRELCYESWRRNDLIRFGKFEDSWVLKTDADVNHRVFPVPQSEITNNPILTQNDGY
ncbi:MAG: RagB/SusD family nutrient uptake outer membrane protein [Mangrovibacterium sp.]